MVITTSHGTLGLELRLMATQPFLIGGRIIVILNSGNFWGRKLSQIGEKYSFMEKTFADCLLVPCQRKPHPQILWRKLS